MLRLPPILCRAGEIRLPMSESSARILVETLLEDGSQLGPDSLSEALALDPPLSLWVLCQARQRHNAQLRSTRQAAGWLLVNAPTVLSDATSSRDRLNDSDDGLSRRVCADLAAEGVQVAELAAHLAGSQREDIRQEAYLAALVHGWPRWSRDAGVDDEQALGPLLPSWILRVVSELGSEDEHPEPPSRQHVLQALAILQAKDPDTTETAAVAMPDRRRAAEIRRRWLARVPRAGHRLLRLTERLARLEVLEQHFAETLETEKLAAMAELAAGAGHEINPPLTIISGRVQLFLQDEENPERRRALAAINRQALRVHEMIADMMLFARPESPQVEWVELVALADTVINELEPASAERQIQMLRLGDESSVSVRADPVQLGVAVKVLVANALEAVGPGGRVEIAIGRSTRLEEPSAASSEERNEDPLAKAGRSFPDGRCDGEAVEISVRDDGPGIPEEVRRHIFDPFYSGRAAGRGLGFGLPKCWRIVTNHEGRIEVESQPGHGTRFRITLPVAGPRGAAAGSSS